MNDLKQFLLSFTSRLEELACILETTHGLLIAFLLSAGIHVYPVNQKTINGLRKAAGAKTDRIDARLLAKVGYFNLAELHCLEPDSLTVQELKTLTRVTFTVTTGSFQVYQVNQPVRVIYVPTDQNCARIDGRMRWMPPCLGLCLGLGFAALTVIFALPLITIHW